MHISNHGLACGEVGAEAPGGDVGLEPGCVHSHEVVEGYAVGGDEGVVATILQSVYGTLLGGHLLGPVGEVDESDRKPVLGCIVGEAYLGDIAVGEEGGHASSEVDVLCYHDIPYGQGASAGDGDPAVDDSGEFGSLGNRDRPTIVVFLFGIDIERRIRTVSHPCHRGQDDVPVHRYVDLVGTYLLPSIVDRDVVQHIYDSVWDIVEGLLQCGVEREPIVLHHGEREIRHAYQG